ncbi:MAG: SDR family oxidoreductase [Solirubrobacteraceae bacterium]|nr:SDR family oxidoreductase [Solirubrobacteraceae bacterium]
MARQQRIIVGQVAAITGGGRGIGRATAHALAREGVKVAVGDIDVAAAETVAAELGAGAVAAGVDVTDHDSFERFVETVEERLGPLDVLVNNAGIMQLGPYLEEPLSTTRRMIDINVYGVHHGCQIALRRMVPRGRGHILNVASIAGKMGYAGGASYSATKHYVVGLSESLRSELRGTGVEVSCVMPVVVQTELGSGLPSTRGVKPVTPEDVAAEMVSALKQPRFDVYVPGSVGTLTQLSAALPRRGREALTRALKADRVLALADPEARRAYELRAARSTTAELAEAEKRQLDQGTRP